VKGNGSDSLLGDGAAGPWYQTAVRTAVVGGVFSAIVLSLLIVNYVRRVAIDEKRIEQLDALKLEIVGDPGNEELGNRIRELDLVVRQARLRRNRFSSRGGWLMLGGAVVLLIGVKSAVSLRKKPPLPGVGGDAGPNQIRDATAGRWAVTVGLGILGLGAVWLALDGSPGFYEAEEMVSAYPSAEEIAANWGRFRGPSGSGVSAYTNVSSHWDANTTGEGVVWKSKVPLAGHSSPVVWGGRVFVSGADKARREVYCFDAFSGDMLWRGPVDTGNTDELDPMEDTGLAAPTVVTDGRRVCAIFATGDVGCFDVKGKELWVKSLGTPENSYGYATSPVLYRGLLLIQHDQGSDDAGKSKLIGLSVYSGEPVWQMNRPVGEAWTSPIVARVGEQDQLLTVSQPWVIGYDPGTGAELWRAECMGADLAPSPIYAGGFVFAIEPHNYLVAIRPDGSGDVTKTHIAWTNDNGGPDICSPVSDGERILLLSGSTLSCHQVTDGKLLWEEELEGYYSASPSLVGDRLYILSDAGVMYIAEYKSGYKELARCELGEQCRASPAFADGRIYIRGVENLYCIGTK
jgi:outer membrane protein assembly factor BamB